MREDNEKDGEKRVGSQGLKPRYGYFYFLETPTVASAIIIACG